MLCAKANEKSSAAQKNLLALDGRNNIYRVIENLVTPNPAKTNHFSLHMAKIFCFVLSGLDRMNIGYTERCPVQIYFALSGLESLSNIFFPSRSSAGHA